MPELTAFEGDLEQDEDYEGVRFADDQNTLVLPAAVVLNLRVDWQITRRVGVFG